MKNTMFNCSFPEAILSKVQNDIYFSQNSNNVEIVGPAAHKIEIAAETPCRQNLLTSSNCNNITGHSLSIDDLNRIQGWPTGWQPQKYLRYF